MHILKYYYWPGNIRQLRNAMERAILLATETLDVSHLPEEIAKLTATPLGKTKGVRVNLQSMEERALREALEANGGNKAAAAAELGISLRTLYYWLKRFDLQSPAEEPES
jgi:transcriptional regulator with PAS, ATPase and Fis domain